jgi:hypothetical protein
MPDWNAAPYDQYQPAFDEGYTANRTRHPVLGVISFVLPLLSVTFLIAMMVLAAVSAGGKPAQQSPLTLVIGLGVCSTPALALVGLGLAIGSMFQRGSKVFGILGIVFNAILLLGSILLLIVALILGVAAVKHPPAAGGGLASGGRKDAFCARMHDRPISLMSA